MRVFPTLPRRRSTLTARDFEASLRAPRGCSFLPFSSLPFGIELQRPTILDHQFARLVQMHHRATRH